MNNIRLIVSDMDGTLLNSKKNISEKSLNVINQLSEQSIIFAIGSGRNLHDLKHYAAQFLQPPPIISINGGLIYNEKQEVIYDQPLAIDVIKSLIHELDQFNVYYDLLGENLSYSNNREARKCLIQNILNTNNIKTKASDDHRYFDVQFVDYNDALFSRVNIYKFSVINFGEHDLEEIALHISDKIPCEISSSGANNIEINPIGVNKGEGIKKLCVYYSIDLKQVLAIGDNINDISMLETAGVFCAMQNSHPDILERSQYITNSNNEDGVANAILKLIK